MRCTKHLSSVCTCTFLLAINFTLLLPSVSNRYVKDMAVRDIRLCHSKQPCNAAQNRLLWREKLALHEPHHELASVLSYNDI